MFDKIYIEKDSIGRDVVHGVNERGSYLLNMSFVMYGYGDGRPWISSEGDKPHSLSPPEAELLTWYVERFPPAEHRIFSGEPPSG